VLLDLVRLGASEDPRRPLVVAPDGDLTYGAALARAEAVARGLRARGVARFAIAGASAADVVVLLAGACGAGSEPCVHPATAPASAGDLVVRAAAELEQPDGPAPGGAAAAPVLVLTTGTTGAPKAVRHDWAALAAALPPARIDRDARWLLAYDLGQFAGLQVLLHVLLTRGALVVPPSRAPGDVVATLGAARVTHASATPTCWRLVAGALDGRAAAGLALRQITLGGEAAPQGLLDRLAALFPRARVTHVYAGTEFGSVLAVHDGRAGLPAAAVRNGHLRVVDGELHVRAGRTGAWLGTGDLVELRGDRVAFVGRRSEVINVGGAKVHPLPVEELVCAVAGVRLAAVYGRPNAVTGQLVAVDVVAQPGADPRAVEAAIRDACAALPAPARPRRIRFVDELETRGTKLVRAPAGAPA
jgi:acyl-CoA synthetase (AMP-forming)/AMP-acid ligase II